MIHVGQQISSKKKSQSVKNTEKDDGIFYNVANKQKVKVWTLTLVFLCIIWNERGDAGYLPLFSDCKPTFCVLIVEDTKQMSYLGKP